MSLNLKRSSEERTNSYETIDSWKSPGVGPPGFTERDALGDQAVVVGFFLPMTSAMIATISPMTPTPIAM